MDKYLIILQNNNKEIILKADRIEAELTDGRTFFYMQDTAYDKIVAVAPITAMIIKIDQPD